MQRADQGQVLVSEKDISNFKYKKISSVRLNHIGYIFQSAHLIPYLKVKDQLKLILNMNKNQRKDGDDRIMSLLSAMGIKNRVFHYPHQLSGGEKQRVAVARAFINDPGIILANEPTASLDSKRSMDIMQLITKQVKEGNKSALIVTHDESILPLCDRVYVLEDGKLLLKEEKEG